MGFPKASRRAQETLNYRVFYGRIERPRTSAIEVRRAECLFTLTKSSDHDPAEAIALGRGEGIGASSRPHRLASWILSNLTSAVA